MNIFLMLLVKELLLINLEKKIILKKKLLELNELGIGKNSITFE